MTLATIFGGGFGLSLALQFCYSGNEVLLSSSVRTSFMEMAKSLICGTGKVFFIWLFVETHVRLSC